MICTMQWNTDFCPFRLTRLCLFNFSLQNSFGNVFLTQKLFTVSGEPSYMSDKSLVRTSETVLRLPNEPPEQLGQIPRNGWYGLLESKCSAFSKANWWIHCVARPDLSMSWDSDDFCHLWLPRQEVQTSGWSEHRRIIRYLSHCNLCIINCKTIQLLLYLLVQWRTLTTNAFWTQKGKLDHHLCIRGNSNTWCMVSVAVQWAEKTNSSWINCINLSFFGKTAKRQLFKLRRSVEVVSAAHRQ